MGKEMCTFPGNGGDSKVIDEFRMTPLHRTMVYSKDIKLTELLCENGADLNAVDIRGNSPLAAMCDAFPLGIQQFLEERPLSDPYLECCHLRGKDDFLDYLLAQKDIKVGHRHNLYIVFLKYLLAQKYLWV